MGVLQHLVAHCLHRDVLENCRDGERCGFIVHGCADARGGISSWQQDELPQQALQNGMALRGGSCGNTSTELPPRAPAASFPLWAAFFRCSLGTKTSALGQRNSWHCRSIGTGCEPQVTFPAMFQHQLGQDIILPSVRTCHQLALCLRVPPAVPPASQGCPHGHVWGPCPGTSIPQPS